jgi:NAD(P)-dependent dehydrogenase (short-subunit alcohol dehydrogenase family)
LALNSLHELLGQFVFCLNVQPGTNSLTFSVTAMSSLHQLMSTALASGFGPASTATDVIKGIDLTGKIAIVTGGYAGLGLETTKALVSAGATVIVGVRTPEKAVASLSGLAVECANLDLLDPASIDHFAATFISSGRPLHILINNAAIMVTPLLRDSRGYESQFSTNHLGHFQLTARLWPALVKANGARVVCLASLAHHSSDLPDDWNFTSREYDANLSYAQSKTANILFSVALDKRASKFNVRAFSLHPGAILETSLCRPNVGPEKIQAWIKRGFLDPDGKPIKDPQRQFKTIEQGAATTVWAATSPLLEGKGGLYLENANVSVRQAELVDRDPVSGVDPRGFYGVKDYAIDPVAADKLWALSEKLTGVTFSI